MERPGSFHPLASNLAGEQFLRGQKKAIWIITGSKGIGKTHFCYRLIQQCQSINLSRGGILSQARIEYGRKTGIFLEDLKTGEEYLLGKDAADKEYFKKVGCWYFSPEVLRWGNRCLDMAAGSDVVIFDECGFLEFENGEGMQSGLKLVDARDFKLGVVVVRPSLVSIAKARWPEAVVFDLEKVLS